jgi:hypothetical protein
MRFILEKISYRMYIPKVSPTVELRRGGRASVDVIWTFGRKRNIFAGTCKQGIQVSGM